METVLVLFYQTPLNRYSN